jgi:hypothetical protein
MNQLAVCPGGNVLKDITLKELQERLTVGPIVFQVLLFVCIEEQVIVIKRKGYAYILY